MLLCCVDFMLCNGLESPAGDGGSYYRLLAATHWGAGENQIAGQHGCQPEIASAVAA